MSERVRQDAVSSEIVSYIKRMISTGKWPVGSKIPSENMLRDRLNVSRTSLRSAIMQLSALNVLKAKQGVGTFVISELHEDAIFEGTGKNLAVKKEIVQILEFLKIVAPTAIFIEMKKFNKCFSGMDKQLAAAVENQRALAATNQAEFLVACFEAPTAIFIEMKKFNKCFSGMDKQLAAAVENQRALAATNQAEFLVACFEFHTMIFNNIVNEFVKKTVTEGIARLQNAVSSLQPTISTQVILTLHNNNEFVKKTVTEGIARLQNAVSSLQPTISTQVILTLHNKLIQAIIEEDAKRASHVLKKLYTYLTAHDYLRSLA